MCGFVKNAESNGKGWGVQVMKGFNSKTLPVLSTLAKEFAVFDHWYASHPGPTEVNRFFLHSGTSNGIANNELDIELVGLPQKTIFQSLNDNGISFNIYMEEISQTLFFSQMRSLKYLERYRFMGDFYYDARKGRLPQYSFLEPRYYSLPGINANDQHPSHDVEEGELFIKNIYESLRASPQWNKTVLIITYDEHGGFYDHVPPPMDGIPNPDGKIANDPFFNFTRLGIRIPTVIVSPLIPKGTLVHKADGPTSTSQFDHTSVPSFLKRHFNLPSFLTKRDEWAGHFDHIFSLNQPRSDCPNHLPMPHQISLRKDQYKQPMHDLQKLLVKLMASINGDKLQENLETEFDGARYIAKQVQQLLPKKS